MNRLMHLWRLLSDTPEACPTHAPLIAPAMAKRSRIGSLESMMKPENAGTYDALTLQALMSAPLTIKSLTRYLEIYGSRPNDVGACLRRVRLKLRRQGIRIRECDVKLQRGARHKKHWLELDDIRRLQTMKPGAAL